MAWKTESKLLTTACKALPDLAPPTSPLDASSPERLSLATYLE